MPVHHLREPDADAESRSPPCERVAASLVEDGLELVRAEYDRRKPEPA
jgi:hypothetical protein